MTGTQPRWMSRPEASTWGDWRPDDQLGRLNLLTPERVRAAAQEVRKGVVLCLSLPLDRPGGNVLSRHPPVLRPTLRKGRPRAQLAHNRCAVLEGRDRRLLQWITESGL